MGRSLPKPLQLDIGCPSSLLRHLAQKITAKLPFLFLPPRLDDCFLPSKPINANGFKPIEKGEYPLAEQIRPKMSLWVRGLHSVDLDHGGWIRSCFNIRP